jgi:hypothetical protein
MKRLLACPRVCGMKFRDFVNARKILINTTHQADAVQIDALAKLYDSEREAHRNKGDQYAPMQIKTADGSSSLLLIEWKRQTEEGARQGIFLDLGEYDLAAVHAKKARKVNLTPLLVPEPADQKPAVQMK